MLINVTLNVNKKLGYLATTLQKDGRDFHCFGHYRRPLLGAHFLLVEIQVGASMSTIGQESLLTLACYFMHTTNRLFAGKGLGSDKLFQ